MNLAVIQAGYRGINLFRVFCQLGQESCAQMARTTKRHNCSAPKLRGKGAFWETPPAFTRHTVFDLSSLRPILTVRHLLKHHWAIVRLQPDAILEAMDA